MGKFNYLIEGVSGVGKSAVCRALRLRGIAAVDGDRELAYQGDPQTGAPTTQRGHAYHIWDVEKVEHIAAQQDEAWTFFCGGSRNFHRFLHLFDAVFILDVDVDTLNARLDSREDNDWGKSEEERALILRLHATREDLPADAITIDASRPLDVVLDDILSRVKAVS